MKQIIIGDKKSFDDFNVLLKKGWFLSNPEPKTQYIDIPASDGSIDVSEDLTGYPTYKDRNFNCELILMPPRNNWEVIRQNITNYYNGKKMKIITPDNDTHYLIGRITVGGLTYDEAFGGIKLTARCEPYYYKNEVTEQDITVTDTYNGILTNSGKNVVPEIITNDPISITINDITKNISEGSYKFLDFLLLKGDTPFTIVKELQEQVIGLSSSGTQAINTGYQPLKTKMELTFSMNDITDSTKYIAGVYASNNRYYPAYYTTNLRSGDASGTAIILGVKDTNKHTVIYNDDGGAVIFDGIQKGVVADLTVSPNPIYLFCRNNGNTPSDIANVTIYSCKIWDKVSNILMRDFVPVPTGDTTYSVNPSPSNCMWDKVTEQYYENIGTGEFAIAYYDTTPDTVNVNIRYQEMIQ